MKKSFVIISAVGFAKKEAERTEVSASVQERKAA